MKAREEPEEQESEEKMQAESGESSSGEGEESGEDEGESSQNEEESEVKVEKEDIYGQKREEKETRAEKKYISPHLRNQSEEESSMREVRRQVTSLMNKVGKENIVFTCQSVEKIFSSSPPQQFSEMFVGKFLADCQIDNNQLASKLVLYYSFVFAYLFASNQKSSILISHLLESLVSLFRKILPALSLEENVKELTSSQDLKENKDEGTAKNVVRMFAHLYQFKVISCHLIFDLIRLLISDLNPLTIELLLCILQEVGSFIRKDDPASLAQIIKSLLSNPYVSGTDRQKSPLHGRVSYMLQMITEIKNNKSAQKEFAHTQLQQIFRSATKNRQNTPFTVGWTDILQSETNGKWWLVGSAFANSKNSSKFVDKKDGAELEFQLENEEDDFQSNEKLLTIASKHKMNTPVRKSIFMVVLTSTDYMECFERIDKLKLSGRQERDIVYVVGHCCLSEKKYNEFYSMLAQRLCLHNSQFALTFRNYFKDRIKQIDSLNDQQVQNLSNLLFHLLANLADANLNLQLLSVINFLSDLSPKTLAFLNNLFTSIFAKFTIVPAEKIPHMFKSLSGKKEELGLVREGLLLFFVSSLKFGSSFSLSSHQKQLIKDRIKIATTVLRSYESVI